MLFDENGFLDEIIFPMFDYFKLLKILFPKKLFSTKKVIFLMKSFFHSWFLGLWNMLSPKKNYFHQKGIFLVEILLSCLVTLNSWKCYLQRNFPSKKKKKENNFHCLWGDMIFLISVTTFIWYYSFQPKLRHCSHLVIFKTSRKHYYHTPIQKQRR